MPNLFELTTLHVFFSLAVAYVMGSIPTAVWIGKLFYRIDVRKEGSGNAGATNTFRVLGKKAGTAVLTFDVLKGFLAVWLVHFIYTGEELARNTSTLQIVNGLTAVVGHIYPVFAGFKGGKGVATSLGMILAIHPEAAFSCIGVFLLVFIPTGYVSLGSMTAALAFPIFLLSGIFGHSDAVLIGFGCFMGLFEIYTHRANVSRLLSRNENKIYLIKRK